MYLKKIVDYSKSCLLALLKECYFLSPLDVLEQFN